MSENLMFKTYIYYYIILYTNTPVGHSTLYSCATGSYRSRMIIIIVMDYAVSEYAISTILCVNAKVNNNIIIFQRVSACFIYHRYGYNNIIRIESASETQA